MEITETNVKQLFAFMNERHRIYLRRQQGEEWPWTDDKILQTYSFTNVYRQLDRGTLWLTKNIVEQHAYENPLLFFNILVYRCHNRISTAERLGWIKNYDEYSAKHWEFIMEELAHSGQHVFTNAYMVTGSVRENGVVPKSKIHQMFGITFPYAWNHIWDTIPEPGSTLEAAFNRLALKVPGIGNFVGYEIITDLRHTVYLDNASDILTWCNPGPGCRRGLGRLVNKEVTHHSQYVVRNTQDCLALMQLLLAISPQYLASWMPSLEMRDVEHSLCEFDKYERVRLGQGKCRRKFNPRIGDVLK